jgi:hypothetical protein
VFERFEFETFDVGIGLTDNGVTKTDECTALGLELFVFVWFEFEMFDV